MNWLASIVAAGGAIRAFSAEQKTVTETPVAGNRTRPARDPYLSQGSTRNALSGGLRVLFGRVVDAVAYTRLYRVQLEGGNTVIRCCDSAQTGLGVTGARQLNTYPVGTLVLVARPDQAVYGIILCSYPSWAYSRRHGIGDSVVQGSNVGFRSDLAHAYPAALARGGGLIDFSAGRPVDSLPAGEWGAVSELGLRVFLDPFMIQVAVDETTGVFCTYFDQMLRLAGHNLQIRSAVCDREDVDDESELSSVEGYTPYGWEPLGALDSATPTAVELTAEQVQAGATNRTRLEPVSDLQQGFYRDRTFRGYLGQGEYKVVQAPAGSGINLYDATQSGVGVLSESYGLDGSYQMRVAQSYIVAKTPAIPSPKRHRLPEDPNGDSSYASGYASCGLYGGPPHAVTGAPAYPGTDYTVEAAAVLDMAAYAFNWKGEHPFVYHELDWRLPDESETLAAASLAAGGPVFNDLAAGQFLNEPTWYTLDVDERYGAVAYYANVALFALLPAGGVVIKDGAGSELRMTGGSLYLNAPGDVVLTAGRSIVNMAGWDWVARANNSADLSANYRDVRVHAYDKVMISGGSNGCGGVLIESAATGFDFQDGEPEQTVSGILLSAPRSGVAVYAGTQQFGGSDRFVIDVGDDGEIYLNGKYCYRRFERAIDVFTGAGEGAGVIDWGGEDNVIFGNLIVSRALTSAGCLTALDSVEVLGQFCIHNIFYVTEEQNDAMVKMAGDIEGRLSTLAPAVAAAAEVATWLTANTSVADIEFYYRAASQYMTDGGWSMPEPLWQQTARLTNQGEVWVELPHVGTATGLPTLPYPGYGVLNGAGSLTLQPLNLFNVTAQLAVGHADEGYTTAELAAPVPVSLAANWLTIMKPQDH